MEPHNPKQNGLQAVEWSGIGVVDLVEWSGCFGSRVLPNRPKVSLLFHCSVFDMTADVYVACCSCES